MWFKQCHKPPIWGWFIAPIYGDDWGIVYYCFNHIIYWLVVTGTMEFYDFPSYWEWNIIPTDELIFFRGVETIKHINILYKFV